MRLVAILCFAVSALAVSASAQTPPAAPAAPAPVLGLTAQNFARYERASEVQLRDVAAIVRVRPENRTDVAIAVINSGPLAAPRLRMSGRKLVIDGGLRRQIRSCNVHNNIFSVQTARNGVLRTAELPTIELRVPQNAVVSANGAVRMRIGAAQSATISLAGCGDADIDRIADSGEVAVSGSSDVRIADAGELEAAVAGSGNVSAGLVRNGLTVSVAGSGDFIGARVDGPTNIALQGSGDVTIRDGRATTLSIAIAGSGDVIHNGSAQRLDAAILGSGDIRVRRVDGEINRRVIGGGEVTVGR